MRPYQVLLFIAAVMACLAALCIVLPGRFAFQDKELRWPTLTEVLGEEETLPLFADDNEDPEEKSEIAPDTVALAETTDTLPSQSEKVEQKTVPVIPKVNVDSTADSRIFLKDFYA